MNRREFLQLGPVSLLIGPAGLAQTAPVTTPPKAARITSSIMLWTLKGSFEEKLAVAAEVGFQSVELITEYLIWTDAEAAKYKSLVQSYGMTIDVLLGQSDWTKRPVSMVNPGHREGFLADVGTAIRWAKRLSVPQIIVMSGNVQPDLSSEAQHASLVESGKRAAELAQAADVTLILEPLNSKVNHKGYYLTSNREGLAVVKEVDQPHFRLLFDIYHEQVQNDDVLSILPEAEPYVSVFHVADAPGRHDPGSGKMDYDKIYRAIAKTGYSGYIAMEYLPLGDEVISLKKAVTDMRRSLNGVTALNVQGSAGLRMSVSSGVKCFPCKADIVRWAYFGRPKNRT